MTMRVFMTTDAVGGVWRYATTLAARLAADGLTIRLGVVGDPPSLGQAKDVSAIRGVDLVPLSAPLDWLAGDAEALARGRRAIGKAAEEWHADVIQLNQPAYGGAGYSVPVLVASHSCVETWWRSTHGSPTPESWVWHRNAVGEGLKTAKAVVVPSAAFAALVEYVYELKKPPIVVHNGIPPRAYLAPKHRQILAAGRAWDKSKNLVLLNEAAPQIAWPVRLAGALTEPDGAGAMHLPNLTYLGQLGAAAMAGELAAAPIFVSPSLYEPFGLAVLEAAQAGAALLLSDIPTFRELWDDAALFFDPRNRNALAAQANRLIRDPALVVRQGQAARKRARRFTIERTAAEMQALYRSLTKSRTGAEALV